MSHKIGLLIWWFGVRCLLPLMAQDDGTFGFNIGGGLSAPLNPTAQYAGMSGNFTFGAGYNINKKNAIIGEFM